LPKPVPRSPRLAFSLKIGIDRCGFAQRRIRTNEHHAGVCRCASPEAGTIHHHPPMDPGKEVGVAAGVNTVRSVQLARPQTGTAQGSGELRHRVSRPERLHRCSGDQQHPTVAGQPYLLKTMSYDPVKDFTPIARTGDLSLMLVINPEIPANSVAN